MWLADTQPPRAFEPRQAFVRQSNQRGHEGLFRFLLQCPQVRRHSLVCGDVQTHAPSTCRCSAIDCASARTRAPHASHVTNTLERGFWVCASRAFARARASRHSSSARPAAAYASFSQFIRLTPHGPDPRTLRQSIGRPDPSPRPSGKGLFRSTQPARSRRQCARSGSRPSSARPKGTDRA